MTYSRAMVPPAQAWSPQRHDLSPQSSLDYAAGWLSAVASSEQMRVLLEQVPWQQRPITLFGRRVLQPRLIAWFGDMPYRYSGQTLEPRTTPGWLRELWLKIQTDTGLSFNHVLLNRYRSGSDSMGLHSDNEPELGKDPQVAVLSLGAERKLRFKPRHGDFESFELQPASGSLLVMRGRCQSQFRHEIVKTALPMPERVSLTFRRVLRAPTAGL